MLPRFPTFSISNILIYISAIFTAISFLYPDILRLGMNSYYLDQWIYHIFIIQIFTSNFLHGGLMHIAFNSLFVYLFWNQVENLLGTKKYIIFFIFTAIITWLGLTAVNAGNTIGISWFCLSLLTYYTLALWQRGNMEYKWWITAIIVNMAVWLYPWVSFAGHGFWVVAGVLFFLLTSNIIEKMRK